MTLALTEERQTLIEEAARDRHTLMDRVVIELVAEIRRLRGLLGPPESR